MPRLDFVRPGPSTGTHLHASSRLVLGLRCSWCLGSAPMPKLLELYALRPARRQAELGYSRARAVFTRTPAGRSLGGDWIGQKKDKSGKGKATDQDRPVPHVEAKNSTLRHCGDEL
jgi:hypothetical protein